MCNLSAKIARCNLIEKERERKHSVHNSNVFHCSICFSILQYFIFLLIRLVLRYDLHNNFFTWFPIVRMKIIHFGITFRWKLMLGCLLLNNVSFYLFVCLAAFFLSNRLWTRENSKRSYRRCRFEVGKMNLRFLSDDSYTMLRWNIHSITLRFFW